tara:strand:+ start:538 stop:774 length:237 start_codon:yes stop_codon:yes gene_type:complete
MERIDKKWCANINDWKNWIPYPYKGHTLTDPQYIKDRDKLFAEHGNGWWWGNGWWNGDRESPMEKQRRYKREKREKEK